MDRFAINDKAVTGELLDSIEMLNQVYNKENNVLFFDNERIYLMS